MNHSSVSFRGICTSYNSELPFLKDSKAVPFTGNLEDGRACLPVSVEDKVLTSRPATSGHSGGAFCTDRPLTFHFPDSTGDPVTPHSSVLPLTGPTSLWKSEWSSAFFRTVSIYWIKSIFITFTNVQLCLTRESLNCFFSSTLVTYAFYPMNYEHNLFFL